MDKILFGKFNEKKVSAKSWLMSEFLAQNHVRVFGAPLYTVMTSKRDSPMRNFLISTENMALASKK